jgi:hypothetical protein
VRKYANVQIGKCVNGKICKCENVQNEQIGKFADMQKEELIYK